MTKAKVETLPTSAEVSKRIGALEERIAAAEDKLREVPRQRRQFALPAAEGDESAAKKLRALDDDEAEFKREASHLGVALDQARGLLKEAREAEARADLERRQKEAEALKDRIIAAAERFDETAKALREDAGVV